MPSDRSVNPELPSLFINQALTAPDPRWPWPQDIFNKTVDASRDLIREHGDRFWQDLNVDNDAAFPHAVWQITEPELVTVSTGRGEHVYCHRTVAYVYSRRKYPQGDATYWPMTRAYENMRQCLLNSIETPISVNNDFVGHITQCRTRPNDGLWRRNYSSTPEGSTIVEYGLKLEIVYN